MAKPVEIRVEPACVGQFIGGKWPVTMACPKCHLPAWRQSETSYVHSASITLDQKNNPKLTVRVSCTFGVKEKARRKR
jgi:hypothetical protein